MIIRKLLLSKLLISSFIIISLLIGGWYVINALMLVLRIKKIFYFNQTVESEIFNMGSIGFTLFVIYSLFISIYFLHHLLKDIKTS